MKYRTSLLRSAFGWLFAALLVALMFCPRPASACDQCQIAPTAHLAVLHDTGPSHVEPTILQCAGAVKYEPFSGTIAIGGGFTGWPTQDRTENTPTSLLAEVKLKYKPSQRSGPTFGIGYRHAFFDDRWRYWAGREKFTADFDYPINSVLTFFTSYERATRARPTHDWGWSGIRFNF